MTMDEFDVAIVGAGAAGSILAARLSEDSSRRVVVVEAGSDMPPNSPPEDIQDEFPVAYSNPAYFWPGLTAIAAADRGESPFPQARVMGGGSSVMGMWALRGMPDDYNAWRDAGAAGWSWDDVLPFFRKLEFGSGSIRADAWRGRADPDSQAQAGKLAVIRRKTG